MEVENSDILAAIVAAHRAIACEKAARSDSRNVMIWTEVAAAEHRKKRLALARFEHSCGVGAPQGLKGSADG